MGVLLKNNTSSLLVGSVSAGTTSVVVTTGAGAGFPAVGVGDYFYATLVSPTGLYEIVKCTARVNDVLTIVRAQEGTVAIPFPDGSRIDLRVTAQSVIDAIADRVALKDQASEISFAPTGTISATNVQDAIVEISSASEISFTPTGSISSTNVQNAIVEVANEHDDAAEISIADAGGYYTGTNVEAALQELRAVSLNTFTGNGSTVNFTISATYGLENLTSVHINGVYQHKATYSLSGTTLTFSEAPPVNSIIEVLVR
jgi:hypothetical protein